MKKWMKNRLSRMMMLALMASISIFGAGLDSATAGTATASPAIADLAVVKSDIHSVQLKWSAPVDEAQLDHYDVRYSWSPITEANWDQATHADLKLFQDRTVASGRTVTFQVNRLDTNVTYYFAAKTIDSSEHASPLSNVVRATTYTPTPDKVTVSSLGALRNAIENAPPAGRIITLAAGTYHQAKTIHITNHDNITIQGATSGFNDTVIAGPGINNSSVPENIAITNSSYVTIRNLTLKNTYYHGIKVNWGSHYFHAAHVKTWDNGESGFKVAKGRGYADYGLIENCLIGTTSGGHRSVVEGIDIVGAKGWVIRGNTFDNVDSSHGGWAVFAKGNSIDTIIEANIVKNGFIGISFGGGGTAARYFRNQDTKYESRGGVVRNNVIYNLKDTGIYMNKAHNFKVYNNTVMNVARDGAGAIESRYAASSGIIRNNLTDGIIKKRDGGTAVVDSNVTDATNALFIGPTSGNYHLTPAADIAIDRGYRLPADVPLDMDGQARPYGSSFDIGADEYVDK